MDYHEMFDNFVDGMEGYLREDELNDPALREQERQERERDWDKED